MNNENLSNSVSTRPYLFIWLNIIAFIAMVGINALANMMPLNGRTTGQVSANYPNLFTPAGFTFSIWGLIYLMMGVFVLYMLIMAGNSESGIRLQDSIGIWFFCSCLLNIAWIFSWHYDQIGLSVIAIAGLLITLIIINMRLSLDESSSFGEHMITYGFQLYLGWITAATIANISVWLVKMNWKGFGLSEFLWMEIILAVGTLLGVAFTLVGHRYFSTIAVVWAYFGILMRHISESGSERSHQTIIVSLIVCMMIMIFTVVLTMIMLNYRKHHVGALA